MNKPIERNASALVLVLTLVLVSACGGESSRPAEAASTTDPTTSATTSAPGNPGTGRPSTTPPTTSTLPPSDPLTFESLRGINTIQDFSGFTSRGMTRWEQALPDVEDIRITSTADGAEQPALWLPPTGDRDRPLLVILHSWSSSYLQHAGIPYAMWARENGWAVIAPAFRGVNDDPDALGSDLAVQDVVDAIHHAASRDGVDAGRVYAVGYSGGGMMALLLAGRYPDEVAAVAAWGPPYDLIEFYRRSLEVGPGYAADIRAGCGGDPTQSGPAREECLHRSPMTHLDRAREQGVPVFIAQGISDSLVSPSQGAKAFNQLADSEDRLSADEVDEIGRGTLPDHLAGSITTETYFGDGDPDPVFARQSGEAWLILFGAGHDMVYEATLRWFASGPG